MHPRRFATADPTPSSDTLEFSPEALRRQGERFAEAIVASVQPELEGSEHLSADAMVELVRADLARAIDAIAERRLPNEQELADSATTAARMARMGVPIEEVFRARRLAIGRARELLRNGDAAGAPLDPEARIECVYRLWEWSEAIQAADAEAHRIAETSGDDDEQRAWFVRTLLSGGLTHGEVSARATAYGLLPGTPYRAFRARAPTAAGRRALARDVEATGTVDGGGVLTTTIDGDLCGVVARRPTISGEGVVGLGMETDLVRLSASFETANRALQTAVAFSYDGVVAVEDLSLRSAVLSEPYLGERMVARYLEPLHDLGEFGATLETTVRVYLEHGMRIDDSAKALFVHPNTLRHRLDRFQQLTGANLRNTEHVLEIWWALERRRLDVRKPAVAAEG